jgi:glycosyltransferase involved in cell wall biosynthesis
MMSVVIPSLGGDLSKTLDSLNSGTVKPDEIIICVPNKSHSVKGLSIYKNTVVVYAEKYGQVYQRICGFKVANGDYILQIDDDIVVSSDCLELLMSSMINSQGKVAVSPCWFNLANSEPLHQYKRTGILMFSYYWILNGVRGYSPGEVSLAGTNFGVNPKEVHGEIINVDWQPGGCVLHNKKNLILDNYYPYEGKAYSEDLIHSFLLRQFGVSLLVNVKAICMTHLNPRLSKFGEIVSDFKAKRYFVKLANLSLVRMIACYIIQIALLTIFAMTNIKKTVNKPS